MFLDIKNMKFSKKLEPAKAMTTPGHMLFARDKISKANIVVKEYQVFKHPAQYVHMKGDKHYYEIINDLQCLYMDIDIPTSNTINNTIVTSFIDALEKHCKLSYDTDVNIYSSNVSSKYSYHIILRHIAVKDNTQCRQRITDLLSTFDNEMKQYIDMKVYRKNQLLRLIHSSKIGKDNVKIFVRGSNPSFMDSLVVPHNIRGLCVLNDLNIAYDILPIRMQVCNKLY